MYQVIDNINDRKVLVLLDNIRDRNKKEQREYERLSNIYVDNEAYASAIKSKFVKEGLMECIMPLPERGKFGAEYKYPPQYLTTEKGRKAVTNGLFKSESLERRNGKITKLVTLISSVIAAIGALCALLKPLIRLVCSQ